MLPFEIEIILKRLFSIPEPKKRETANFLRENGFSNLLEGAEDKKKMPHMF